MSTITLGIATGAWVGLVAVGIVLVYKSSRILNFAQAEFGTFALYIYWALVPERGWPWPAGWAVAIGVMALTGFAFERLVVRQMGDASKVALSVSTVGLFFLLSALEIKVWSPSPRLVTPPFGRGGVSVFGFVLTPLHLVAIGLLAAVAVGLGILIARTRAGLALLAVAEDAETARLMGVPYHRVAAATWAVAGALGAVAGLVAGPLLGAFAPLSLTTDLFVPGLTAALLGGLTSLPGAFIGGVAVGIVQAELKTHLPSVIGIASYGMLGVTLLVLLVRPRGLLGREA
jgi:branched-chain amino acid transport system permease protein